MKNITLTRFPRFRFKTMMRASLIGALLAPAMLASQITHTWVGGTSAQWSNPLNWSTNLVPVHGDALIFTGDNTYIDAGGPWNDIPQSGDAAYPPPATVRPIRLSGITFDANASAFILGGDALRIGGRIVNNSDHLQVIEVTQMQVIPGWVIPNSAPGVEGLEIDTGKAGITIRSNVVQNDAARAFSKTGAGVLTLYGNNVTSHNTIKQGTLIQDGGTFGGTQWQSRLVLGSGRDLNDVASMYSARIELLNDAVGRFSDLIMQPFSGANQVVVAGGAEMFMTHIFQFNGNNYPSSVSDPNTTTLNIDLSGGGSLTGGVSTTAGIQNRGLTVSQMTVDGKKTGFAWVDSTTKEVSRAVVGPGILTAMPTGVSLNTGTHYALVSSGSTISAGTDTNDANGYIRGSSLTIRGTGGTLQTTHAGNNRMYIQYILMEEGTGDFVINAHLYTNSPYIHQYSTDGKLTLGRNIMATGHFVKTGPGAVELSHGLTSATSTVAEIQGGRFILDGSFGSTPRFYVRGQDAILSGQGSIGGTSDVYTAVHVFDGGTLDGNNDLAKALDITGSLTFRNDGQYLMNLKANPNDVLTVLGTATDAEINLAGNLILTLDYDYSGGAPIILMRTDGTIAGGFDTINGDSFLNGTLFSLTYDTNQYWFEIDYGYDLGSGFTGVALYAIPEPATVALLLGVALSGLVWLRRRRG